MHLMYVDESGDDGFKLDLPPDTPGSSKVFIRTGLIVHDRRWRRVNSEIKRFRTNHDIPRNIEIHASAIMRGGKKHYNSEGRRIDNPNWYGKVMPNKDDQRKLLVELCRCIGSLSDITLICIVIDKTRIDQTHPEGFVHLPKHQSWEFLIERYNLFLRRQKDRIGIIISDAVEDQMEKTHRDFAKSIYDKSPHVHEFHFIESIFFEPSDSSFGFILAAADYRCGILCVLQEIRFSGFIVLRLSLEENLQRQRPARGHRTEDMAVDSGRLKALR